MNESERRFGEPRRFSEGEQALILKRAAELQEQLSSPASRGELTLEELQSVALGAGIDAELIAQAAAALPPTESHARGYFGPAANYQFSDIVSGSLSEIAIRDLIDLARTDTTLQGEVSEVLDSVEWKARDSIGGFVVSLAPHEAGHRLRVHIQRADVKVITWLVGTVLGLLATGTTAAVIGAHTGRAAQVIAMLLAGGAATYGGVFAIWTTAARRFEERGRRLFDRLLRTGRELARADEPAAPSTSNSGGNPLMQRP
jgi:hypothetical protein